MSPLKIKVLLNMHCLTRPFDGYTPQQANSYAMHDAFEDFRVQGLLADGVALQSVIDGTCSFPRLTESGLDVVRRLCEVEP